MEVINRTIFQISLIDSAAKQNQCDICSYAFGLFKKSYLCKRCYRTICLPCGQNKAIVKGSLNADNKPRKVCTKCAEENKNNLGTVKECKLKFGEDSLIGLNWLRYLSSNKEEADEDFKEQSLKSSSSNIGNEFLSKKISQIELIIDKGYLGINTFNFSLYEIINELHVDNAKVKQGIVNVLTPFFFVNKKLLVSIELLQLTLFFLLISSESVAFKFLKSYFSLLPSYILDSEKVIDIFSQKIFSQFQNDPIMTSNKKNFDINFLASKYNSYIASFFVNYLRFETQITLIDSIFISKSFNRIEQTIFKIFQNFIVSKLNKNQFDRYLLLISSNTIFQNLPRSLSKSYTKELETLMTQQDDEDYHDIINSNGVREERQPKKHHQSYYERENQELKQKLTEKNDQIKKLQEKLFAQTVGPKQQDQAIMKKMQTEITILQKKIKDQQKFIEELTHKIVKQKQEKEEQDSLHKARDLMQNELKEMCNQIKSQMNDEIQSQLKANLAENFQNFTPNKSLENGEIQQFQYDNLQSLNQISTTTTSNFNPNRVNHLSFDLQNNNRQKNESFFSTIYQNHSRQNSQFADLQCMNNLLGEINQQQQVPSQFLVVPHQNHRQLHHNQGNSIDISNTKTQSNQKSAKKCMSVCDDDKELISSHLDISQNTKKSNTSSDSIQEERALFDQSVIERLDKLQGLLLKDQKIISQLFFGQPVKSSSD